MKNLSCFESRLNQLPKFVVFICYIRVIFQHLLLTFLFIVNTFFSREYHTLTHCLMTMSEVCGCFYPNPDTQELFLHVHSLYFHNCSREEEDLEDAPYGVVVTLTLVPISLIPVLVYLLVWRLAAASSNTHLHS